MKELFTENILSGETKAPEGFLLDKGELPVFIEKGRNNLVPLRIMLVLDLSNDSYAWNTENRQDIFRW